MRTSNRLKSVLIKSIFQVSIKLVLHNLTPQPDRQPVVQQQSRNSWVGFSQLQALNHLEGLSWSVVVTMARLAPLLLLLLGEITAAASQGVEFDAVSSEQCFLTPDLGNIGTRKFLEECEEIGERFPLHFMFYDISIFLGRFTKLPKPLTDSTSAFGVHPVICCPDHQSEDEEYIYDPDYDPEYDSDYDYNFDFVAPSPPPTV